MSLNLFLVFNVNDSNTGIDFFLVYLTRVKTECLLLLCRQESYVITPRGRIRQGVQGWLMVDATCILKGCFLLQHPLLM